MFLPDEALASDGEEAMLSAYGEFLKRATNVANAKKALEEALQLASTAPPSLKAQSLILQIREKAGDNATLLADVEQLYRLSPDDRPLLELFLRRLVKGHAKERALEELDAVLPSESFSGSDAISRAEILYRIQAFEEGDAAFERSLWLEDLPATRILWAKHLVKRFMFEDAGLLLADCRDSLTGEKGRELVDTIETQREFYRRFYDADGMRGQDFRLLAMEQAVLHYRNRATEAKLPPYLHVDLVTGSLGAGGAERQLCGVAQFVRSSTAEKSGIEKVKVIVKEHARAGVSDFFLDGLEKAGVAVYQINEMKPVNAAQQAELPADLGHFLSMLPPQVHYGVVRLAAHWRAEKPDVASIWQDGACLFGALAALFAGVPRIQLVFRGLPPNIRMHRMKPEYAPLYRALVQIPGVEFVSNSQIGADAYAKWLGIDAAKIHVLYNGVAPPKTEADSADVISWEEFDARTQNASETIGGVFRFESDKRPFDWIRVAAAYRKMRPDARFIIVGGGRMMEKAKELAEQLKLTDHLLFVGHSKAVGFWYGKMDVKLLMSRFEGLPNVLIEAQYLGTPVVSTPAGGAEECFVAGETGYILNCAENPHYELACEYISKLVDQRKAHPEALSKAAMKVAKGFSSANMMKKFNAICRAPLQQGAS